MCEEWHEANNFFEWALSNGYEKNLSLDRIDVNGDYSASNCRWVSHKQQMNNTRKNIRLTHKSETHTLSEWADIVGVDYNVFYGKYRAGWTIDKLLKLGKEI